MKKSILILSVLFALSACTLDDAEWGSVNELVAKKESATVGKTGGKADIVIFSSGDVTVTPMNDFSKFATLNKDHFCGDDTLRVTFDANDGLQRMAKLLLTLDAEPSKKDTVWFKQEGDVAYFECASPFSTIDGSVPGASTFEFSTNIPLDEVPYTVSYVKGGEGWVNSVSSDGPLKMVVTTSRNTSDQISKACIALEYVDGWDNPLMVNLYITASGNDGNFGTVVDFSKVRELATGKPIEDEIIIEGIIVSDFHSKNTDLNPSISYDTVDVSESDRTAYLQTTDGSMGVRLKFSDPAFNVLTFGTKVSVCLQGLSIEKDADAECYTIKNLSSDSVVNSEAGLTVTPKTRTIAQLSDEDIFTFVEITGTEFVWKTGAFSNVYENYALKSEVNSMCSGNNNRFDGWATLLVDGSGKAIYAPINMLCTWRRNQKGVPEGIPYGVPQGVGSVKGVVVHNVIPRYGDVGRYQVRVIDQTGFCQEWEGESAYTTLAKWDGENYQYRADNKCYSTWNSGRYVDPGSTKRFNQIVPSDDISADKQVPAGELSFENKTLSASYKNYAFWHYYSHNALVVNGTKDSAGDRGRASNSSFNDHKYCCFQLNNDVKGWYKWTDGKISGYNGIVMTTSTKDISGSGMYVAYAFEDGRISAATSQYFPAHWCIEYSVDGGKTFTLCPDAATGKDYTHLHAMPWYDVNIGGIKYYTAAACGIGATEHVAFLGQDAFGLDKLVIRLRPYDDVMSIFPMQWDGNTENSHVYANTTADVALNVEYIYIRYKK